MIETFEDLHRVLAEVFPASVPPKPLHLVNPIARVRAGELSPREAASIARTTPKRIVEIATAAIEDQIVDRLVGDPAAFDFQKVVGGYLNDIRSAGWYVLSARRAYNLLRENLFQRAYALRVPRFAQNYRGAELDMHFSLSNDLTSLTEFLEVLRENGMPGLVSRLERGTL